MFTRFQLYVLAACLVAGIAVSAVVLLWQPDSTNRSRSFAAPGAPPTEAGVKNEPIRNASRRQPTRQETPLPVGCFKLTAKSHNVATPSTGEEQVLDADMELVYSHQKGADGMLISFYSVELKAFENGRLIEGFLLTRDKEVTQTGARRAERSFDELPPIQQQRMEASFATPFCRIVMDENFNETRREIVAQPGTSVINEGILNCTRLAHGPFAKGARDWTGLARIPVQNSTIDCAVSYTKVSGSDHQVTVAGSMSKDEISFESSDVTMKKVSTSLSGSEVFDEAAGDYTSGELRARYSFQVFESGIHSVTIRGELALSLEQIGAKKP